MKIIYKKVATIIVLATFTSLMTFAFINQFSSSKQEEVLSQSEEDENISEASPSFEENEALFIQNYNTAFNLKFLDKTSLTLQREDDKKFLLEGNENKAVLFMFLNDSCLQCDIQLDILKNLEKKYKNKILFIGLFANELDNESVNNFIKNKKISFKMSNDYEDIEFFIRALKNIDALPYMLLFKADGSIAGKYKGILPSEMLESELLRII